MNGSLLVLGDIIEIDDSLGRRLEVNRLPFGIIGEDVIFHIITNQIFSNYTFALSSSNHNYNYINFDEEKLRTQTRRIK